MRDVLNIFESEEIPKEYTPVTALAIINTLSHEGGYVWDEHDAGGETNFGISKRANPEIDIKALTLHEASRIYFHKYWLPSGVYRLKNAVLACLFFDMCVNAGIPRATKLLQEVCGETQDGILGKLTAKACNEHESIVYEYTRRREQFYFDIAGDGNNKRFLNGWLRRCHNFESILEAQWKLRDLLDLDDLYENADTDRGGIPEKDLRSGAIVSRVLGAYTRGQAGTPKHIDTGVVAHIG